MCLGNKTAATGICLDRSRVPNPESRIVLWALGPEINTQAKSSVAKPINKPTHSQINNGTQQYQMLNQVARWINVLGRRIVKYVLLAESEEEQPTQMACRDNQ